MLEHACRYKESAAEVESLLAERGTALCQAPWKGSHEVTLV